jgi:hypothetical protein
LNDYKRPLSGGDRFEKDREAILLKVRGVLIGDGHAKTTLNSNKRPEHTPRYQIETKA